jgi:hypothetical protein
MVQSAPIMRIKMMYYDYSLIIGLLEVLLIILQSFEAGDLLCHVPELEIQSLSKSSSDVL